MDKEYLVSTLFCRTCNELNSSWNIICDRCKLSQSTSATAVITEEIEEDDFTLFRKNIYEDIKMKWIPFLNANFADFAFKSYAMFLSRRAVHAAQRGFREPSFEAFFTRVLCDINILYDRNTLKRKLSSFAIITLYSISYFSYILGMMNFKMMRTYYTLADYERVFETITSEIVQVPGDLPRHYVNDESLTHRAITGRQMLRFVCMFLCKNSLVDTSDLYSCMY